MKSLWKCLITDNLYFIPQKKWLAIAVTSKIHVMDESSGFIQLTTEDTDCKETLWWPVLILQVCQLEWSRKKYRVAKKKKKTTQSSNRPNLKLEGQKEGLWSGTAGENRRLYIDAEKLNQTKECICTSSVSALQNIYIYVTLQTVDLKIKHCHISMYIFTQI